MSTALSADGNTLAIGGPSDNNGTGTVWIFARSGNAWGQQGGKLIPASSTPASAGTPSKAGSHVALSNDGNTLIVSAYNAATIFTRTGTTWSQQGGDIDNSYFSVGGVALSGDGNLALVGEPMDTSGSPNAVLAGRGARVFTRKNGNWSAQGGLLTGSGAVGRGDGLGGFQGLAVALSTDGSTALITGPEDNAYAGATWVFTQPAPITSGQPSPGGTDWQPTGTWSVQ